MKTIVQLFFSSTPINAEGGTEKVFVELSNLAVEKNYKVIDICNSKPNEKPFFLLNEKVEFHNLGLGKIKVPFYKKIAREITKIFHLDIENYVDKHKTKILTEHVNHILKDRDVYVIICYETNSVAVTNNIESNAPKIEMAHNHAEKLLKALSKRQIEKTNKMDAYQVLMPSFINEARKYLNTKIVYIPNIVPQVNCDIGVKQPRDKKIIINIGRIDSHQKRQDILVEAFAKIAHRFGHSWEVHLYGAAQDEKYKNSIEKFIKNNNLSNLVIFKGTTKEPLKELQNADIFAFPSAHEGFPLALSEAMSIGLPSIGFENAPGVNTLINDKKNGFLCKDVDDFADKLSILMSNEDLRVTMGLNARENMKEYSSDKVWAKWEQLFDELNTQS